MAIVQWDPFRELEQVSDRLNRIFGRSATSGGARDEMTVADWAPSVDIAETDRDYQIKAELPEVKKDDIKVAVDNGVLRIQGERKKETEEKGHRWHRVERSYGSFLRTFTLPDDADAANVSAEYKDGMLVVHLPKSPETKPKSIDVKVS